MRRISFALALLLPAVANAQTVLQFNSGNGMTPGDALVIGPQPSPLSARDGGAPAALASGGTSVPTTGGTVSPAANTTFYFINPAGTLSTLTYNLPLIPSGQCHIFMSSQIVTTLTMGVSNYGSAAGIAAPTALAVNTPIEYCIEGTVAVRIQ